MTSQKALGLSYRDGMEVFFEPFLALAALKKSDSDVDCTALEGKLEGTPGKAKQAIFGGLAGLPGQFVQLPG